MLGEVHGGEGGGGEVESTLSSDRVTVWPFLNIVFILKCVVCTLDILVWCLYTLDRLLHREILSLLISIVFHKQSMTNREWEMYILYISSCTSCTVWWGFTVFMFELIKQQFTTILLLTHWLLQFPPYQAVIEAKYRLVFPSGVQSPSLVYQPRNHHHWMTVRFPSQRFSGR